MLLGMNESRKPKEKKNLEINENENVICQNLWDAAKTFLRGKFIPIQSYLRIHCILTTTSPLLCFRTKTTWS